jgi:hypothetical protein
MRTLWAIILALWFGFAAAAQQQVNNFRVLTNLYVGGAITGTTLNGYNIDAIATNSAANKLNTTNGAAVNLTGSLTNISIYGGTVIDTGDELQDTVDYSLALTPNGNTPTENDATPRPQTVATIASLTADVDPLLVPSYAQVNVLGYTSSGDGGGGVFRRVLYSSVSGTEGEDGMWFQSSNNPLYAWERVSDSATLLPEWFGAVTYTVAFSPYFNESLSTNMPGTADFSVWLDWQVPTYSSDTTFAEGVLRWQGKSGLARDIEAYGTTNSFEVLVRSTTGSSSTGSGAGKLTATPNPFLAYQGTRIQVTLARTNGVFKVYRGTNDITSSFTVTNSSDLAGEIGNGDTSGILSTSPTSANVPRQPVFEIRTFGSALTLAQIAAAGSANNYTATVSSLNTATSFTDSGPAIQAALDYAKSAGIGAVTLGGGQYFSGQQINVPTRVSLVGVAPSQWSGESPRMNNPVKLSLLWSATSVTNLVSINAANSDTTYRNLNTTFGDGSYGTNYFTGASVRNLWLDASAVRYATPLDIYKVSNVTADNLSLQQWDGPMFRVYQGNGIEINKIHATRSIGVMRPPYVMQTSDSYVTDCDYGGFEGVGLFLYGNKNKINGNFIWNAQAFSTALTAPTVDTGADTFTSASYRFYTGMPVRFSANGGTLPSPLSESTLYFVVRVDADTFGVNSQYDQGAAGGALQGVKLDLTTGGSGSWRVFPYVPAEANITIFKGDDNEVLGGRFDQSYGSAVRLDQSYWNKVSANLAEAGYNNATNIPSVFITGGGTNIVTDATMGRTRSASQSAIGVLMTNTVGNVVRDNIYVNQDWPVVIDTATALALPDVFNPDGNVVVGRASLSSSATTGFLYVPGTTGTPAGTPTAVSGQIPLTFDASNRLLYWHDGTKWQRWQFYPTDATGSVITDVNGSMTLTQTNATPLTLTSVGSLGTLALNGYSAGKGSGYGSRMSFYRANGTSGSPTGIATGETLGAIFSSGYNGSGNSGAATEIEMFALENWTSTNNGAGLRLKTTPTGSTTRATVLEVGNSSVTITGNVATSGSINLGNSDTTLARSAAGVVTIEGVKIATQPTTETLTYSGGTNVTITAGKGPNQRSLLTVTNNFQLLWSGLTDNDGGVVHLIPATTNVTVLVSSPGRAAGSSAATATGSTTLTITGATNGWAELAWSVVSVGGTNRVSVNLGAY